MSGPLSRLDGVLTVMTLLVESGSVCPKCAHGTRRTSKNWAKCKSCGERVQHRDMQEVAAELRERVRGLKEQNDEQA